MASPLSQLPGIDRRTCKRVVPMRVLCLGLPRTGTASIRAALKELGYDDVYHYFMIWQENQRDAEMWADALQAKNHGIGKKFGRAEFDQLLGHCQAVTDYPANGFADALIEAYPDAKVILNTREPESWWKSYSTTLVPVFYKHADNGPPGLKALWRFIYKSLEPYAPQDVWEEYIWDDFHRRANDKGAQCIIDHDNWIRSLKPDGDILEYSVKQGWEPLCKFLGHEIPDKPFPRLNDTESILAACDAIVYGPANRVVATKLIIGATCVLAPLLWLDYTRGFLFFPGLKR